MHELTLDQAEQQFRVYLEQDLYGVAKFRFHDSVYTITSTKVPKLLQGRGYGKVLMEAVLKEIESRGAKVAGECRFVVIYLERNKQWQHLSV